MRTIKTLAVIGSMAALALGMSAVPAQATAAGAAGSRQIADPNEAACLQYLNSVGYPTTPATMQGCNWGLYSYNNCLSFLMSRAGVSAAHAQRACYLAHF